MSAAITAAVVGVAGNAYMQNKASKAQKSAQQGAQDTMSGAAGAANQASWSDINRVNDLNRQNATWTQQQNQAANDRNMINASNAWGGVNRTRDPVTGELRQASTLAGPWDEVVNNAGSQYGVMQKGLSGDQFGINSDVYKAVQGLSNPQLELQRNRENARLAAMGLGTGSGRAWGTAQDALNNSENDMTNRNILTGNQAWLAGQGNLRSNMDAIMKGQQGIKGLAQQDPWEQATTPQMTQPMVGTPENMTYEAMQAQAELGMLGGAQAGQNAAGWGSAINGLLGNKDVQGGLKSAGNAIGDWWNTPSSSVGTPDYNSWQNQGNYGWGTGEL